MKTSGNYIKGFVIAILFSVSLMAYSQQSFWDMLHVGKTLTSDNKYAVGETSIIFSETVSNRVYAFSTIIGNWDSAAIATTLPWTDAAAGGSCAMLLNDSLAVFYSAINSDFAVLRFEGQVLTTARKLFGCNAGMGYVVTNSKIYVFDAEDSQIRSASYSSVGSAFNGDVYTGDDYLCLNIFSDNLTLQTLVAYSAVTKSLSEITGVNLPLFRQLEHGFIFGGTSGAIYLCGGYSSYTGTFVTKSSDIYINDVLHQYDLKRVYPRLCYLFNSRSEVGTNGMATSYLWVFNTLTGTFDEFSYEYNYNETHLVPNDMGTGGQGIYHIIYDKDKGNKVNLITYDVYSRAFTQHDFNITYDYRNVNYIGGHIIALTTKDKLVFYDILSGDSTIYNSDWQAGQFPGIQSIGLGNNYATIVYYKGPGAQGMTVFNYSGTTDSIKNVSFATSNNYFDVFGTKDYSLVKFVNYTQPAEHLLYSVANDSWLVKSVASSGVITGEKSGYYFLTDNNQHSTTFYNAESGNEITILASKSGTFYSADSIFIMPANDQNYYGYSAITNSVAAHPIINYSGIEYRNNNIFIYHTPLNPDNPSHLLFDGNLGIFVTLNTNSQTHGTRILTRAGGKTALTVYNKGYLFAYDPGEYTSVDESPSAPDSFQLYQNQPNPFNTATIITWQLPNDAHVVLKVYDFTGREVKTLVDGKQEKGEHTATFNAQSLPAGVYFYQLRVNGKVETKKMLYLK
ncbi:MAG: T9SS type A sorting domain-containing protein [Bacteroidales bacterium]|nr:T9SS type A sorting domain-containing protein [Bacteroidales bacterium]